LGLGFEGLRVGVEGLGCTAPAKKPRTVSSPSVCAACLYVTVQGFPFIRTYTDTYIHTQIRTYIHTYVHTYIEAEDRFEPQCVRRLLWGFI